jgi:hypothetical protein
MAVSATTVRKLLREVHLGPVRTRSGPTWRESIRAQARSLIAVDFFTVDTLWLQQLNRRKCSHHDFVRHARIPQSPTDTWVR